MAGIPGETKSVAGRKPNPIIYNEKEDCVECIVSYKKEQVIFLIDKDDLEKVKTRNWHLRIRCELQRAPCDFRYGGVKLFKLII